jgi:Protein of unknown function (DUF3298).
MKRLVLATLFLALAVLTACGDETALVGSDTTQSPGGVLSPASQTTDVNTGDNPLPAPVAEPLTYEISETYNEEFTAEDGTVIHTARYERPIFAGESADIFNAVYAAEEENFIANESGMAASMLDYYNETLTYDESYFEAGETTSEVESVFIKDSVISIVKIDYIYGGGAHGVSYYDIKNFDITTGEELKLEDIIKTDAHSALMELFYEQCDSPFDDAWTDEDKAKAAETLTIETASVFLTEESAWVLWNDQYTFFYAYGSPIISVPYSNNEILK